MATYSTEILINENGRTYDVSLNRWTYTVGLTTTSEHFYGQTISIYKTAIDPANLVGTVAFDNRGIASYNIHETGTWFFSVTYDGESYIASTTVSTQESGSTTLLLNEFTVTLQIETDVSASTGYPEFVGKSVAVYLGDTFVSNVGIGSDGKAIFLAHSKDATYKFVFTNSLRESYTITFPTITASDDGTTITRTLTRYYSTITVNTTTSEFTSQTMSVGYSTTENGTYTAIENATFVSGTVVYDVHKDGWYKFTLTYDNGNEVYEGKEQITATGQSKSITINRYTATATITVGDNDLLGHSVTVYKDNVNIGNITLPSTLNTSINYVVHQQGTYSFVLTYSIDEVYTETITFNTSVITKNFTFKRFTANIAVSTSSVELVNHVLTISMGNTTVGTITLPGTVDTSVIYVARKAGDYKFSIIYEGDNKEYSKTVTGVADGGSYSANVSLKPPVIAWTSATDAQIKAIIDAYYAGQLTLTEIQQVWKVGDSRNVSLSAMSATGVGESHRAQTVQMTILDFDHDTLKTAINGKTKALITVQQKDCLRDGSVSDTSGSSNTEHGYMNSSNTNNGGWGNCARRTWCNNVYYAALPSGFKELVKQVTKENNSGGGSAFAGTATDDYIWLPSEHEVFGATTYSGRQEGTQYEYYKTASNRYKLPKWNSSSVSDSWWERSPNGSYTTYFCRVDRGGSSDCYGASGAYGLAPACSL